MSSNALALVGQRPTSVLPREDEFTRMCRMAELYAKSGILPKGITNMAAAALVIEQGFELGIAPAAALRTITLVEGKLTLDAMMQRALIYRDHGDDALKFTKTNATECVLRYKRKGWDDYETYTLTMAEIPADIKKKYNWRDWPANMLRARTTTFVAVMAFSDTTLGLYSPEEMGAEVEVGPDGEPHVIEATARTVARNEEEYPAPAPTQQPARSSLPVTRNKPAAQPNGQEEQRRKLVEAAQARGIDLTEDMDASDMATVLDTALSAAGFGHRVVRTPEGAATARALSNAILAFPPRTVDRETGEVQEQPIEGETREATPDDEYEDLARMTDADIAAGKQRAFTVEG